MRDAAIADALGSEGGNTGRLLFPLAIMGMLALKRLMSTPLERRRRRQIRPRRRGKPRLVLVLLVEHIIIASSGSDATRIGGY
jgi:hypothetical protein